MSDLVRRQSEMAVRVDSFGNENSNVFKNNLKAVAAFAVVHAGVSRLHELGALRESSAQTKFEYSDRRKAFRERLYSTITGLAKTARQIARENPDFINNFKAPQDNRNDTTLIDTARSFAENLPPVKELFIEMAEEDDFIEDLLEEIDDFERSIGGQDTSNRQRIGAGAEIDDILGDILPAVRMLNVILPKLLKDNPGKLAEWFTAIHIQRAPSRAKTTQTSP